MGSDSILNEKKPRKKRLKKRTENKVRNATISCMRQSFAKYSPKIKSVRDACKTRVERLKKDGSPHKVPWAMYECAICKELVPDKETNVDHIIPVAEIGVTYNDMTLDEIFNRIDCDESNLQVICKPCHKVKSKEERELRKIAKNNKEKIDGDVLLQDV